MTERPGCPGRRSTLVPGGPRRLAAAAGLALAAACGGGSSDTTSPGTGTLAVEISGLPGATAARVSVAGPGGFVRELDVSDTLSGLLPGTYGVSALDVTTANQVYRGSVSSDSIPVQAGGVAEVAVQYTGGPLPTIDLGIQGVELLQSTQRPDGSVPMVAGRDALVRVFVVANESNTARPDVRVRLYNSTTLVDSLTIVAPTPAAPLAPDTADLASSWNAIIPGARVLSGLTVRAEVDPINAIAEVDETNNLYPAASQQPVTVQAVPQFDLRFVPVRQSVNGLVGNVSQSNQADLIDWTRRMMPLGAVNVDVRSTYATSAPVLQANDSNSAWGQVLSEIYALRAADGSSRDYLGIVQVSYGGGIAGLGYIGAPAAIAWDKTTSAPDVITHELGHNFGRQHAPCGNPTGPDPAYPYAGGSIGVYGVDLGTMTLKSPAIDADVMSYCSPDWISDYTYLGVMAFRGGSAAVAASEAPGRAEPGLLLWGRVRANGELILEPAFRVVAPPRLPISSGRGQYRISGLTAAGGRVFSLGFDGELVPDLPGGPEHHFAFVVPLSDADLSAVHSLRLEGGGVSAVRGPLQAPPAAGGPPSLGIRRLDRQRLEVTWDPRYPMALVRDATTGAILSFARGGRGEVGAPGGRVTVELSDGVGSRGRRLVTVP